MAARSSGVMPVMEARRDDERLKRRRSNRTFAWMKTAWNETKTRYAATAR